MGCVYSKDLDDANTHIFHVWNVDDRGNHVNPGKIEVTENDLILHQKGKTPIRWPLRSLRRYGFDAELFSFESGRRCPTGPGIYAFKCHHAEVLFNVLQECIQNSGGGGAVAVGPEEQGNAIAMVATAASADISQVDGNAGGRSSPALDSSGYLEPISGNLQQPRRCPVSHWGNSVAGDGLVCVLSRSNSASFAASSFPAPRTSSSHTICCGSGTCARPGYRHHYANEEVFGHRSLSFAPQYVNSSVAIENGPKCGVCREHSEMPYADGQSVLVPPDPSSQSRCPASACCPVHCSGSVDFNTNYAKLDDLLKQEHSVKWQKDQHCYVNIHPEGSTKSGKDKNLQSQCALSRSNTLASPTDPAPQSPNSHFYANVSSPTSLQPASTPVADMAGSEEDRQMNYIVLDLDHNSELAGNGVMSPVSPAPPSAVYSPPGSPCRIPEGYATIDFDKTAALSNSANPFLCNDDNSARKTRHNGTISLAGVPS